MARFDRLTVLNTVLDAGMVPLFYHSSIETAQQVPAALYNGGTRVLEFTNRGDFAIPALIPKRKLDEIWKRSHAVEIEQFALDYLRKKGYPILRRTGDSIVVNRDGQERAYTARDLDKIARNVGHAWRWP
jgi:hypothetical protein